MTKNITLAIDEHLLDKVRVLAAMKRTSVNEMVRQFLEREVTREAKQASRAEVWNRVFEAADGDAERRARRQSGTALSDREEFYEEVMRERRLL
ncbi:MAG: ribbon-helix-helix protein, CopG family [Hyphomicrobiaceae bacterium]